MSQRERNYPLDPPWGSDPTSFITFSRARFVKNDPDLASVRMEAVPHTVSPVPVRPCMISRTSLPISGSLDESYPPHFRLFKSFESKWDGLNEWISSLTSNDPRASQGHRASGRASGRASRGLWLLFSELPKRMLRGDIRPGGRRSAGPRWGDMHAAGQSLPPEMTLKATCSDIKLWTHVGQPQH